MFLREQYKREEESEIKRVFIMPTYPTRISNSVYIHTCDKDTSSNPTQCAFYRSINCCVVCVCIDIPLMAKSEKGRMNTRDDFDIECICFFRVVKTLVCLLLLLPSRPRAVLLYIYIFIAYIGTAVGSFSFSIQFGFAIKDAIRTCTI
jgi:hypothetical protein